MDEDERNRRRNEPGRRAEDYLYESLVDRLRRLEDRFERIVDKFDVAVERLMEQLRRSERQVHERVDELEEYHIGEQATVRTRVADRTKRMETWQKTAIGFSVLASLAAVAALIVSLSN